MRGAGGSGLVGWLAEATGTAEGITELARRMKNSPAPRPMRITAAPATISGVFPRDSLGVDSGAVWVVENLPRTSLEVDGFRAVPPSHVPESDVSSAAGAGALDGE